MLDGVTNSSHIKALCITFILRMLTVISLSGIKP